MPRIVKPATERRAELLGCALTLFFEKGYEATTINDILDRTGLSKGAFYHHFASKEELLDAFTSKLAASMVAAGEELLRDETLSEVARLNRFLESSNRIQYDPEPAPVSVFAAILKPENAQLYQRIMSIGAQTITPMLSEIVDRGIRKGDFDVPDAELAVQMMVQLSTARFPVLVEAVNVARSGDFRRATQILDRRLTAELKFLDRLLGLPPGSIAIFSTNSARMVLAALVNPTKGTSARRKRS